MAMEKGSGVRIENLKETLRKSIHDELPGIDVSFEPSGLIDTMMSQGSPTPIEIAINGPDLKTDRRYAEKIKNKISDLPFLRDLQFGQVYDYPSISIDVDRARAGAMGVTMADVGRAVVPATSSTRFILPNYWSDPKNGINYQVQLQIPQGQVSSIDQLRELPVTVNAGAIPLQRFSKITDAQEIGEYDRYDMQRMITITANLSGMDLGHAAQEIEARIKPLLAEKPRGVEVHFRGQITSLAQMLKGLGLGLALAVVIVFLLLAGGFESFPIALSILFILPAVIAGALSALEITGTTLNIESFMGTIMAVGVAVANSILLVTFAERNRLLAGGALAGAIQGATSRLRPILMTSLAMLIGMIPMSLGLSEGGKQSAPLGRAVMGGLIGSTLTTLLILPLVFVIIRNRKSTRSASLDPDDPRGQHFEKGNQWAA